MIRQQTIFTVLFSVALGACSPEPPAQGTQENFDIDLNAVLGGENTEGYLRADRPREFVFPDDHGMHVGFRNEWWYLNGNMETEDGRRFGYQATFFNTSFSGEQQSEDAGWASPRIWMAHVALTDADNQNHIALERFSRENPGLAGAQMNPFKVWLENWSLQSGSDDFPWQLDIEDDAFSLSLSLNPLKDPVLQGVNGLSQKSPEPGNASYYYSLTRLASNGELTLAGERFSLNGLSWLDREWSTSALADNQSGWDWFSLQFDDGQELMYYQLRDNEGQAHPNSEGNWTDLDAEQSHVTAEDIVLSEITNWNGPNGVSYTTEWHMQYKDQLWTIRALIDDQFMDLSVPYWEGAVDILDPVSGNRLGQGYLEMVRN